MQLVTNALGMAVGSVLQRVINNEARSIAFFSKALNSAQKNYSAFTKERLAIYLSIRHFK